jgi:peptidoglycan/xylan/chitin deacetylase (PgdA/CDA1 family)
MRNFMKMKLFICVNIIMMFFFAVVFFPKVSLVANGPIHYSNKVLVLLYHHLDSSFQSPVTMLPVEFRNHLIALKKANYKIISMDDYIAYSESGKDIPDNAVLITFDDGYESFYTYAYPILKEFGMTATNFLVVGHTDLYQPQALPHISWEQIREMSADGFDFYSHTFDAHRTGSINALGTINKPLLVERQYLPKFKRLETKNEYTKRVKSDLVLAEKRIHQEIGAQVLLLAFPFGAYNQPLLDITRDLGYIKLYTTKPGINAREGNLVFRINAGSPSINDKKLIQILSEYSDRSSTIQDELK